MRKILITMAALLAFSYPASGETVDVKYRGSVDLKPFTCSDISRSSFIGRICYDGANNYMIIKLQETYYHYCEIGQSVVDALMKADSMGRYYNENIKVPKGNFDCRTKRVPIY